jgi:hypothetical protein
MLKWIELDGAVVYPFEPAHLGDIARWMRRYSKVSDFSRYRLPRGKAFIFALTSAG